jgi:hypothetical protein
MTAIPTTTTTTAVLENERTPPFLPHIPHDRDPLTSAFLTLSAFRALDVKPEKPASPLEQKDPASQPQYPFPQTIKRSLLAPPTPRAPKMDLRRNPRLRRFSASSNVNTITADSDLRILPDFEDWELESPVDLPSSCPSPHRQTPGKRNRNSANWSPFVSRAVCSNMERLRRRLEGDGWDFVGGKYGEGRGDVEVDLDLDLSLESRGKVWTSTSTESVDEEFDVVVLGVAIGEVVEAVGA